MNNTAPPTIIEYMAIQITLVILILAGMVVLLLGIDQLFTGKFNADDERANQLRHDVKNKGEVISDNNIFKSLVSDSARRHDNT